MNPQFATLGATLRDVLGDDAIWTHNGLDTPVRGFFEAEFGSSVDRRAAPVKVTFSALAMDMPGVTGGDTLTVDGTAYTVILPHPIDPATGEILLELKAQ